jgi:NAD(P)-dependent dehydrogenase (short-subunit alcohol dehydrogenase family)
VSELAGRRALITGGGGAIGRVALRTLLDMGAEEVLITGRRQELLDEAGGEAPGRISGRRMDVTEQTDWARLMADLTGAGRQVDILIAAAGVAYRGPFLSGQARDWEEMWRTNVLGSLLAVQNLLPSMLERGWGRIILISSAAAHIGLPGRAVYGATKGAVEAFARSIASEVAGQGVLVNTLAPGMFPSAMTQPWLDANPDVADSIRRAIPEHRFGRVEELAGAFRLLLDTSYMQGASLRVDGGWTAV